MDRITYDEVAGKSTGTIRNISQIKEGDKVILTTMGYDHNLRVTPLRVAKITKTMLTLQNPENGQKTTFRVSRAQFLEGEIKTQKDYTGYADRPNLWVPGDPNLARWIAYNKQEAAIDELHTTAGIALSKANTRYLNAEAVQEAIIAGQAWLDATEEYRAEVAAKRAAEAVSA